ncbi:MAG: ABC transporter permease [Clostridia bacterium]|jgi:D-methionine transport system permease protein|nr:ABC transporter permease [Clostridia bacterium]
MNSFLFEPLSETWRIVSSEFPFAIWETLYATVLSTALAIILGLPLGILLVAGEEDGVLPLPKWLLQALNVIINILRSVPFIILMILVIPLTRLLVGKAYGTMASVVPLVIAAFPFIARLVESSLREVDPNLIEMARSMGATPFQIITKVMLRESVPSLISNCTIAITTILGYTAMSGAVGGGGLGKLAITYGYNRYMYGVMAVAVILLVVMVQLFQMIGTKTATRSDMRKR